MERAGGLEKVDDEHESYYVGLVRADEHSKWTYEDGPSNKEIEDCLLVKVSSDQLGLHSNENS